ncbi:MAG TPA: carboxypeptidase regulatory-like domain-containing protein, partial [Thermoplasmata archaeon]|nr:carboxypeptidase regulatory-like domain-containing protein [Thermoplasmata archaeon]
RTQAFYNSMIYRIFVGYRGADVGETSGIPGLNSGDPVMPGWMMQHFRVVYRTAYYCPYANPGAHPGCFQAMNYPDAIALAKKHNGTAVLNSSSQYGVGYFDAGEAFLEYYPGVQLVGQVNLPDGSPVALAHVTVFDEWHIPHMTVTTDASGHYSLILPPGNDTVNVTAGLLNPKTMAGSTSLLSIPLTVPGALAFNPTTPTEVRSFVVQPSNVQGAVFWKTSNNTTLGSSGAVLVAGAQANLWSPGLPAYHATTDASGAFSIGNVVPGSYEFSITYQGGNFTQPPVTARPGSVQNESAGLPSGRIEGTVTSTVGVSGAGAQVIATNGRGDRFSTQAGPTGVFNLTNLGPGNYSVQALSGILGSTLASETLTAPGQTLKLNLTLEPMTQLVFPVLASGVPIPGALVRLVPIVAAPGGLVSNGSSRGATLPGANGPNGTVAVSDESGIVTISVPEGNYSLYAYVPHGSGFLAGFEDAYLPPHTPQFALAPLVLSPAQVLQGTLASPGSPSGGASLTMTFYDARGNQVGFGANLTGGYRVALPAGAYTLQVTSIAAGNPQPFSQIVTVSLPHAGDLNLTLLPALHIAFQVGTIVPGTVPLFPAAAARVSVTNNGTGATVSALTSSIGNVSFNLPTVLGTSGASYCLAVEAPGFIPFQRCGYTAVQLGGISVLPVQFQPVSIVLHVVGLLSGSPVRVNMTATGPPARSLSQNGTDGSVFAVNPGQYQVSAWARSPTTGIYLAVGPLTVTLPLGTLETNLTVRLFQEFRSMGSLTPPPGVSASQVSVSLASPSVTLTLNGSQFTGGFYAPPGNYTVYAFANVTGTPYATLAGFRINATGSITPRLTLSPAGSLLGKLTSSSGAIPNGSVPVSLSTASGLSWTVDASAGTFTLLLPLNLSVNVSVNATVAMPAPGGGSVLQTFTAEPGTACSVQSSVTLCPIPITASLVRTQLNGALQLTGHATTFSGSATFFGPSPQLDRIRVPVVAGAFTASLLPGTYALYVTAGNGSLLGNTSKLSIPLRTQYNVSVALVSTWQASVTPLAPPNATGGLAQVTFRSTGFFQMTFTGVPVGQPIALALPAGIWNVTANATYSPYGVSAPASSSSSLALIAGNGALTLPMHFIFTKSVRFLLAGPTDVTVPANTTLLYSYSVANTGNAPVTVRLVGSPTPWNFSFSPANGTIGVGPGQSALSGVLRLHVPAGTATNHPPIALEAVENGTS